MGDVQVPGAAGESRPKNKKKEMTTNSGGRLAVALKSARQKTQQNKYPERRAQETYRTEGGKHSRGSVDKGK